MTTLTDQLKTAPLPAPPTNVPFTHGYFDGVKGRPYSHDGYSTAEAWLYVEGYSWGAHIRSHGLARGRHRAPSALLARVRAVFQYAPTSTTSPEPTAGAQTSQPAVAPPVATLVAAKSAPAPAGGTRVRVLALAILGWLPSKGSQR